MDDRAKMTIDPKHGAIPRPAIYLPENPNGPTPWEVWATLGGIVLLGVGCSCAWIVARIVCGWLA